MATTTSVTLRVYDLSRGMARQFSPSLLGKQIDGIWHTGVLVFGKEYFFGGGIQAVAPEIVVARYGMQPVQQVPLGETSVTRTEFEAFLRSINHRFTAATYDLLRNNCNNFSNEVALFLVGHGIPEHIINLPNEALSTPLGAMFRPMVENLQREMNATGAQPFGNPFNDVSLAVSPAISSDNAATTANQPALLSRTFTVSSDPTLRLETVVRRIESLNYQQKTLLDGEEIAALKAFTTTVVQLQTQLKSSPSPSSDAPTKVVRQLWSILVKLLQEGALSPFFFPALAVFRVLLLLPTSDADVLVLKTAAFDHLLAVTEAEDIKLTQAQTVLLLTVLVNGFANPAASELVLARALQFLPFVFRSIIETGAHSHDVRIMSAKLIGNCCLAMQVEEELLIMVIIGGCIEVLDRLSREGGATPAATHHIQLTLEGVVVGVGRLLQSFAAARNLSVELGLPEVLQRLHSSPSLFRIRPLLSEVVALI